MGYVATCLLPQAYFTEDEEYHLLNPAFILPEFIIAYR